MKDKHRKKVTKPTQELYAAVDLHGDNGYYCLINPNDQVIYSKRLPNDLNTVLRTLEPFRPHLVKGIAVESTFNWYWLVDGLQDHGYTVQLVNPAKVETYGGLKNTNDRSDAYWLAHLQRLGILPTGYIYPKAQRGVRDLLRRRMRLVQQRTTHLLSFQSLVERQTGKAISSHRIKALELSQVKALLDSPEAALMGQANLHLIEALSREIATLEKAAEQAIQLLPEYQIRLTVPGIGRILAMTIMLETGPIGRFASASHYTSYCCCVKAEAISNGQKKGENNRKCGNRYLAWAFIEAANFAVRYDEQLQRWHQRKLARSGGRKALALKALAAKLTKAVYYLLKEQKPFDIQRICG
jgi:transposase